MYHRKTKTYITLIFVLLILTLTAMSTCSLQYKPDIFMQTQQKTVTPFYEKPWFLFLSDQFPIIDTIHSLFQTIQSKKDKIQIPSISSKIYEGYTLFTPMWDTKTYLIDNNGSVIHTWKSIYTDSQGVYLLENGNLLRTSLVASDTLFSGGAQGRIEIITTDDENIWTYEYASQSYNQHHDVEVLPNGNILLIAWEQKTLNEAISKGKNLENFRGQEMWPDHIIEIKPIGEADIKIIWEWHVWDHLIQDYDPTKQNYGIVANHPELIDINYRSNRADWNHINSIDYNAELDQILLSVKEFNEIWVIDHSTTIKEAAGHSGGRYGKGGDLLYRWGNPAAYDQGSKSDQKFFGQHWGSWIESGYPGEGHIMVFNNGAGREYASVDEIISPIDEQGHYQYIANTAYGPDEQYWVYIAPNPKDLNSATCSSAQRLPNGNTIICSANQGYFVEVNMDKEIVWEYYNNYPLLVPQKTVAEIIKYPTDYSGIPKRSKYNCQESTGLLIVD